MSPISDSAVPSLWWSDGLSGASSRPLRKCSAAVSKSPAVERANALVFFGHRAVQQPSQLHHQRIRRTDLDASPLAAGALRPVPCRPGPDTPARADSERSSRADPPTAPARIDRRRRGSRVCASAARPRPNMRRHQREAAATAPARTAARRSSGSPRSRCTPPSHTSAATSFGRSAQRALEGGRRPSPARPSSCTRDPGSTAIARRPARALARAGSTLRPRRSIRRPAAGCPSRRTPAPTFVRRRVILDLRRQRPVPLAHLLLDATSPCGKARADAPAAGCFRPVPAPAAAFASDAVFGSERTGTRHVPSASAHQGRAPAARSLPFAFLERGVPIDRGRRSTPRSYRPATAPGREPRVPTDRGPTSTRGSLADA